MFSVALDRDELGSVRFHLGGSMSDVVVDLDRNAIGLREVAFRSICSMAPGAAIAASIPFGHE
jgi:hypothetical protein